jgi:hypothetical protein
MRPRRRLPQPCPIHRAQPAQVGDIGVGIGLEQQEVGRLARGDAAGGRLDAERARGAMRGDQAVKPATSVSSSHLN